MALCAIAQHFGRPGTPTDQVWIESLNGTIKIENPYLLATTDPATLRANSPSSEPTTTASGSTPESATSPPNDEHQGRGETIRKAREAGLEQARLRRLTQHRSERDTTTPHGPNDVA